MGTSRRTFKQWSWRCQWSVVTIAALVIYNAVANIWLLRPPTCPIFTTPAPSEPPTCEPCTDTAPNTIDDDPLARLDLRLGRWDATRTVKMYDYAVVGENYPEISSARKVSIATQSSIERLHELLRIAAHWTGPISVAVYVAGDEMKLLRAFVIWLFRCQPEIYSRIALHIAIPIERPVVQGATPKWARDCEARPSLGERKSDTTKSWRTRHPYPQNHLRNLARKNCHTPYVFLVDIDIIPTKGMSEELDRFLETAPSCAMCAYVVPTYELDLRVANFPANKSELVRLSHRKLAIPFHRKVFIYNQYASNFSKWEASGGNESALTHVSHHVSNFELLYEPFYVAPDSVPPHDERFLGYGFTRNTQDVDQETDYDTADEKDLQDLDGELETVCPELSGQIIGGQPTSVNRHPYQVSMVLNGNSFCGGFIISRDYVLTAAHCVQNVNPNGIRLRVGSTRRDSGGRIVQVSNITVHARYGQPRFDNDIAVLRLAAPLTFNANIRSIRLPQLGQAVPLVRLTVTGWGLTMVYEMFLIGYQFKVLSPIFTIHWGIQARRNRPLWREKQNDKNRKHFETFKRELFARYRKDPLHVLKRPKGKKT